jgi:transposase-like protein
VSYAISNYNQNEITGYFDNLHFQHIDSTSIKPLTTKKVQIQTATFLNTIAAKIKKQIMVYTLVDADTNKDGSTDQSDIKSLYVSTMSGEKFTKLTEAFQELIDWNIIEAQKRLYFRCIEDTNKNGAFDKNDKVHYHFVDLSANEWKVEVYTPN